MTLGFIDYGLSQVLFGILCLLEISDAYTTYRFLKLGTAHEANPLAWKMMGKIGFWPTIGLKAVLFIAPTGALMLTGFWPPMILMIMVMVIFTLPNWKYVK